MAAIETSLNLLDSGDRLDRDEFHRRYRARPDIQRAELVEGVVYVPSPTRYALHDEPAAWMIGWLAAYAAQHAGVRVGGSATIVLDDQNEVQPDAFLLRAEPTSAGARPNADGYLEGAPELVVEVAARSASYDLHDKKEAYRRNGVREYVVWRVLDGMIDWFRLSGEHYALVEPDDLGVIESETFPGLRLDVARMLEGDPRGVLARLERDSPG